MSRGRPAAKRTAKKAMRTRTLTRSTVMKKSSLHPFVIAQGNPFHPGAIGVKVPDLNNLPSCTMVCRNMYTLQGSATTGVASVLGTMPKIAYDISKADAVPTTSTWDWSGLTSGTTYTSLDQYTPMYTEFGLVRCAAHGVRLMCGSNDTNTQGFVHIALVGMPSISTSWVLPKSLTDMRNQIVYKKLTVAQLATEPYIFSNRFLDETAFAYRLPNLDYAVGTTTATWNTQTQWGHIVIALEGAVANTVLSIETIHHFECIPKPTYNSTTNSTTPPAANNPDALGEGQLAGNTPGGTERIVNNTLEVIADLSQKAAWVAAYTGDPTLRGIAAASAWINENAQFFARVYNGDLAAAHRLGRMARDMLNRSGSSRPRQRARIGNN